MVEESERLSREWKQQEILDMRSEMRRLTLAIVGTTLFGTDFRESAGRIADVLQRVTGKGSWLVPAITLFEPLAYRRLRPQGRSLFFPREREELRRIVAPMIEQRRGSGKLDVLSLILNQRHEDNGPLTDEDIQNEVVTFVLAGHETTAAALTWTWYLLAQHPMVAARLHAELDEVLGSRSATLADIQWLPYTANVFKEALRLYPPALLFARRPKATLDLGGYRIKAGQSIFVSPYITQRNSKYFARPDDFEPKRWGTINIPKFAYFPFGGGAKMCLGEPFARLEGLVARATLTRNWILSLETGTPVKIGAGAILNPNQPILLRQIKRVPGVKPSAGREATLI